MATTIETSRVKHSYLFFVPISHIPLDQQISVSFRFGIPPTKISVKAGIFEPAWFLPRNLQAKLIGMMQVWATEFRCLKRFSTYGTYQKNYIIYIYIGRELWRLCKTGFHCVMVSQSEKNYLMHSKNLLKFHGPIKVFYSLILAGSFKLHCSCKIHGIFSQLSFKHPLILVSQFSFPDCKSSWSQFFKPNF